MGQVHEVYTEKYYRTFSRAHPVLARVNPGDAVRTRTVDSGGQDEKGERKSEPGNPLTGSFYVEGAEAGDALLVHFNRIRCNRDWGYTSFRLGLWALSPDTIEGIYSNQYKKDLIRPGRADIVPWDIDVKSGLVKLREPKTKSARLEFQARPMLGCVGVAPAGDFAPTSGPSGPYGGNIDYNEIAEGSTVSLPVYHPGALLFVGDGHAVQGDGEPLGTGIETSMDVEFTVELRKKYSLNGPRVETADHVISVGSQPEFASALDRGLQMATSDMVHWLGTDHGMEPWEAHLLIGMVGRYDVVTVAGSMALRIAKRHLPARK
ncbi:MAG: acetamidase/formamidase family protein [Chloroflexi bacterium]|nr:acetamidase/formamidase family protein [Chloroflexota bacterium]